MRVFQADYSSCTYDHDAAIAIAPGNSISVHLLCRQPTWRADDPFVTVISDFPGMPSPYPFVFVASTLTVVDAHVRWYKVEAAVRMDAATLVHHITWRAQHTEAQMTIDVADDVCG